MTRALRVLTVVLLATILLIPFARVSADTFNPNRIIDDSIFNNFGIMNAGQIDSWLNGAFGSTSCISTSHGFSAPDPTGYNPTSGFQFGGNVSAGQVIYDAAQAYNINPQVILTTLQKEQGLVSGSSGCSTLAYAAATGYGCPDSGTTYNYSGVDLYSINGVAVTAVNGTCVNTSLKVGFSQQVIRAAWLLKFGEERSEGNTSWAIIKGNWDNSDDPQSCYGGPMTQGTWQRCPSGATTYYDGYTTIDGTSVHMDNGATATLYWYTPHFSGNQHFSTIFNQWFGSTLVANLPGCTQATNTTRACIWELQAPGGEQLLTSSVTARDELYTNKSYQFVSMPFFGNAVALPGNIPVYRATDPGGGGFLTTDQNEYNAVVASGYTGDGIDFYADPSWSNTGFPVYRLYNPSTLIHFWTTDPQIRQSLVNAGYNYEGIAFTSISAVRQEVAPPQGKLLVYRFYIPQTYSHFWTTDVNERDNMINAGYNYESVAWYTSSNTSYLPVYRLYAPSINQHLFTTDLSEKNGLVASGGWNYEGISQHVSTTANNQPVYRLYAPSLGTHLLTADAYERSQLIASGHWNDEGIAWYQP